MIPVRFPEANAILAANQQEYEPIPVYAYPRDLTGRVACCFRLSDEEIEAIVRTRTIWLEQLTFGTPFAPISLSTLRPLDIPKAKTTI